MLNTVMNTDCSISDDLNPLIERIPLDSDSRILDITPGANGTILMYPLSTEQAGSVLHNLSNKQTDLPAHQHQRIGETIDNLSISDESFDFVLCRYVFSTVSNTFRLIQSLSQAMKSGGRLLLQDTLLPDDERAANYINAFLRLYDPLYQTAYPEYGWQGLFLDAGLHNLKSRRMIQEVRVLNQGAIAQETRLRLQIMLTQSPQAVTDWLQPLYPDSTAAQFMQHTIVIVGEKGA